ncbi:hypothetical protein E4U47_001719 [Claviceps purpurea]|nr:hypothetical protein E4U25_002916 [Claviceps purpurea]KAG6273427.1 hypothetical protein E4U49_000458 [Claviceps purpurea]KAG6274030.1 hypothetical protein E4U47_001719 [Claviceps purpurea]KAG6312183.1 hypothetical protein E4U44_003596 [Claviceps purpurea]
MDLTHHRLLRKLTRSIPRMEASSVRLDSDLIGRSSAVSSIVSVKVLGFRTPGRTSPRMLPRIYQTRP